MKKMFKKSVREIFAILLIISLISSLSGCNKNKEVENKLPTTPSQTETSSQEESSISSDSENEEQHSQDKQNSLEKQCSHSYTSETKNPTCIDDGYIKMICRFCGDSSTQTLSGGHVYENNICKSCKNIDPDNYLSGAEYLFNSVEDPPCRLSSDKGEYSIHFQKRRVLNVIPFPDTTNSRDTVIVGGPSYTTSIKTPSTDYIYFSYDAHDKSLLLYINVYSPTVAKVNFQYSGYIVESLIDPSTIKKDGSHICIDDLGTPEDLEFYNELTAEFLPECLSYFNQLTQQKFGASLDILGFTSYIP